MQRLDDYLQIINPVAVEFKFASDLNRLPYDVKKCDERASTNLV